jgi:hypothetical protein
MRYRLKAWSNAFLSSDQKSLWIQGDLDDSPPIELEIPFELASQLVFGIALAGQTAAAQAGDDPNSTPDFTREEWDAIPVRGLGLGLGRNPAETALVVDLFRTRLAFALDSKKVGALGASFARTAATLSADPAKPS